MKNTNLPHSYLSIMIMMNIMSFWLFLLVFIVLITDQMIRLFHMIKRLTVTL
jgi:hypothetical protein